MEDFVDRIVYVALNPHNSWRLGGRGRNYIRGARSKPLG